MNDKRNSGGTTLPKMIACTRVAIEMNEFMSLLTSLEGRGRNDHATMHESGMGFASSWVQCENTAGLCLRPFSSAAQVQGPGEW